MKSFTRLFFCLAFCSSIETAFAAVPTITGFLPATAGIGQTVTINGTNFTGVTQVLFGGTAASSFNVVSATQITAVVAAGTSGQVSVINADGTGSRTGFYYLTTTGIFTDFSGYWASSATAPNASIANNSQNLLAFTFNGITYSTGVNDPALNTHAVSYTAGNFRALPVSDITGITGTGSTYLAIASGIDGALGTAVVSAVSGYSVRTALTDGIRGLDLGTGVTNLPQSAVMTFGISSIDLGKVNDNEPDIILTQIAQPVTGNDTYSFIDASGNVVGNSLSQDMTRLPSFGNYALDLFTLTTNAPYNSATASGVSSTNTTREMRLVAFRLSDFGIDAANLSQVKSLKIVPSGNSDYAFIAYNANAISLTPTGTLPIKIGSFKASRQKDQVKLDWIAYNQINSARFVIERSFDGANFVAIHTIPVTDASGDTHYEWIDQQPGTGLIFYRMKEVYKSGHTEASQIVSVTLEHQQGDMNVFPNPVKGRQLNLRFNKMMKGKYLVQYFNGAGQLIGNNFISHTGEYKTYHLTLPSFVNPGVTRMLVIDNEGKVSASFSVLVQ